jgi:hypothetical protein
VGAEVSAGGAGETIVSRGQIDSGTGSGRLGTEHPVRQSR